jgi:regulator of RNase E activity RraA
MAIMSIFEGAGMYQLEKLRCFHSSEISDALDACGVEGALLNIKPITSGLQLIGPAYTVQYKSYEEKSKEFKMAGDYIDQVPEHHVIVLDNQGREDCTCWGNILTQFSLMKKISGTVVNGSVRDIDFIKQAQYPVFSRNVYMRSAKNRAYKASEQVQIEIEGITVTPGDIIFGDDLGVLVIPKHLINKVIEKAENIKINEQKIIHAITHDGISLHNARQKYRYDQPWLKLSSAEEKC